MKIQSLLVAVFSVFVGVSIQAQDPGQDVEESSLSLVSSRWVRSRTYVKGDQVNEPPRLELGFEVWFGRRQPISWGRLKVIEVLDENGKNLNSIGSHLSELEGDFLPFEGHGVTARSGGLGLLLPFESPPASTRVLRRVHLSLDLEYGLDPQEITLPLVVGPIDAWTPLPGVEGGRVRVAKMKKDRVEIQILGTDAPILLDVVDEQGEVCPPFSRNRYGYKNERYHRVRFTHGLPEKALLRLRYFSRFESITLDLNLSDVPLP